MRRDSGGDMSPSSKSLSSSSPSASSLSPSSKIPFLEVSGVRPFLTVVALFSAVTQMYLSILSLFDIGCILIGAYVLSVGILSIVFLVALHLMPALFNRTNCFLVFLRRICYGFLMILIPGFAVFNVPAALWVHSDNCWDRIYMRNLAVADLIMTYIILLVTVWYIFDNFIQPSEWWNRKWQVGPKQFFMAIRRHARLTFFLLCLGLMFGGIYKLEAYNDVLVNSYHWSFSERPAPCQKSCRERWQPNKRARKCMNALNQIIPIQLCLDHLAPLEMLPSNHLMLQQCPILQCSYPNGEKLRYHWSMRAEHIVRANECSKHDRRLNEQVALVQEFGCFDESKSVWVDESWCSAHNPPFSAKSENFRLLYWKDKHCLNRCEQVWSVTYMFVAIQAMLALSLIVSWIGRRRFSQKHASSSTSSIQSGDESRGLLSGPVMPTPGSLNPAAPDLLYVRHHLQVINANSWATTRLLRVLFYMHVYGIQVLSFPWRLFTRTLLFIFTSAVAFIAGRNMVWLSDSHCRFFTTIAILNASVAFIAFAAMIAWIIRQLQKGQDTQQAISTIQRSMYAISAKKEENYEDR